MKKKNALALFIFVSLLACLFCTTRIDHANAQAVPTGAPIGTVIAFAGELNDGNLKMFRDAGWLPCDGASLRRLTVSGQPTEYAALYGVIRETYGDGREEPPTPGGVSAKTGDFNLPDMRGRFLRGVDSGMGRDPDAGSRLPMRQGGKAGDQVGSIEADTFAIHNHPLTDPGHAHSIPSRILIDANGGFGHGGHQPGGASTQDAADTKNVGSSRTSISIADAGGSRETRPRNINIFWIIKFK